MERFLLLMHNDAVRAENVEAWGPYIARLNSIGLFDGGSVVGGGRAYRIGGDAAPLLDELVGYLMVHAESIDAAAASVFDNPVYVAGGTVEVRHLPTDGVAVPTSQLGELSIEQKRTIVSHVAERFARIADAFTGRVDAVPADAWDNPAPCEGWVARDIVRHLTEWVPGFFTSTAGLAFPAGPSVDEDPVGAWHVLRRTLDGILADPAVGTREFDAPMGRMTIEAAIDMIVTGDVFLHTWDLARATGLDETLDLAEVQAAYDGMQSMDEMLRTSGHYGPKIDVSADADIQTKLIAFIGRNPARLR